MNYRHFSEIYTGDREFTREKLQFFFDKSFENQDENGLRRQYKALRQLGFNCDFEIVPENVDISLLCENITSAFDVFASQNGKNFIYCGNSTCCVYGNHHLMAKAFLNLLSNAYLYSTNSLVTIKTIESKNVVKVEVQSEGIFPFNTPDGNGLTFVRKVCNISDGHFFIESNHNFSKAVMCFRKTDSQNVFSDTEYDFFNLLTNRLSPVYVEVFGMEYH